MDGAGGRHRGSFCVSGLGRPENWVSISETGEWSSHGCPETRARPVLYTDGSPLVCENAGATSALVSGEGMVDTINSFLHTNQPSAGQSELTRSSLLTGLM